MKKSTKLLSVLLAFVMVISVFAATMASAAAPYKPTYSDEVTEEDVELLLKDVDTVLLAKVLKGSVIESIYKALPGLATYIGTDLSKVEFYSDGIWGRKSSYARDPETQQLVTNYEFNLSKPTTALNQERFADLEAYGDGNRKDNIAAKDADKYPKDMPGRFDKGSIILDQAEEVNENGEVTKEAVEGTFTKFFKDHPIEVNSLDDFKNEINNIVATVLMDRLGLIGMLGSKYTPEQFGGVIPASGGDPQALYDIITALDDVCAGLGIEQTHSAAEFVSWNNKDDEVSLFPTKIQAVDDQGKPTVMDDYGRHVMVDPPEDTIKVGTEYIQNIVNALFKDGALAANVVGVIQSIVIPENGARLYKGLAQIVSGLEAAINSPFGSAYLGKKDEAGNYEEGSIAATLHNLYTTFQSLPTLDTGKDTQRFDIEGLINFVIAQVVDPSTLSLDFVDRAEGNGKAPKKLLSGISTQSDVMPLASDAMISLKFRHMDLDRVAEAESHADVVKIVYDYLYDNLICYRETNDLLTTAFTPIGSQSLIERVLKTDIPKEIEDEILNALKTDREPLAAHLITLVAEMDEVHHHPNLEFVKGTPATCTANGTVDYYHCPDCGLNFATDDPYALDETALTSFVAPATGHQSLTKVEAKAATCTENGNVEYYRCDACGLAFKSEEDAAANNAFDPTVKAAGHQYGEWKEENGKQVRTCSVCGATETKDAAAQPDKTLPQIPVTGAAVTGFSAISLLAAAAFVTMAVRSKKDRDE